MSIDALLFAPDKGVAVREIARVLVRGGRFVATTWDYHTQPVNRPPQVNDHRPDLLEAGFRVVGYDETPNWLENHRKLDSLCSTPSMNSPRRAVTAPRKSEPASRRCPPPLTQCCAAS